MLESGQSVFEHLSQFLFGRWREVGRESGKSWESRKSGESRLRWRSVLLKGGSWLRRWCGRW